MKILIERTGLSKGFNRYMVECEYTTMGHLFGWYYSFNRYMVECELIFLQF